MVRIDVGYKIDVRGKEGEDMDLAFSSYEEFIIDYKNYRMDKCDECGSVREIIVNEECLDHAQNIKRPIVFTEQSVSGVINAFDKVLVEGFNVKQLRVLYEYIYAEVERDSKYKDWQSIRLIKEILLRFCSGTANTIDVEILISPLYILHDYRIYLDHLLSKDKQESTKAHIVATLGVQHFSEQENIYFEEINRLNKLFQYLVLLSR